MRVIATAPGIDSRGMRQEIGSVFDCPRGPKKPDGSPGDEIVKASWYHEYRDGKEKVNEREAGHDIAKVSEREGHDTLRRGGKLVG